MNKQRYIAKILIEQGYAKKLLENDKRVAFEPFIIIRNSGYEVHEKVDITSDTLEARKQLDEVYDYISKNHLPIFATALLGSADIKGMNKHDADIKVVDWCISKLC